DRRRDQRGQLLQHGRERRSRVRGQLAVADLRGDHPPGRQGAQRRRRGRSMSGDFDGKVALVTGAASGIGRAIGPELGGRAARVMMAAANEEAAAEAASEIGDAASMQCDVGDPLAVAGAVATAVERFGGLDVMVNNAGVELATPVTETTTEDAERVLRV